jgi:hypothetical protein
VLILLAGTALATSVAAAAAGLAVAVSSHNVLGAVVGFMAFESTCGAYFPSMASVRAATIPSQSRSTITALLRIPLNMVIIVVLLVVPRVGEHMVRVDLFTVALYYAEGFDLRDMTVTWDPPGPAGLFSAVAQVLAVCACSLAVGSLLAWTLLVRSKDVNVPPATQYGNFQDH